MTLAEVSEPKEIKDLIRDLRSKLGDVQDSSIVWYLNKIPQYIWSVWGKSLRRFGISWQEFLKIVSENNDLLVKWALYDQVGWDDVINKLKSDLLSYVQQRKSRSKTLLSFLK